MRSWILAALLFSLLASGPARAATLTWSGLISSNWDNPSNWIPNQIPTSADHVIINSGPVNIPADGAFAIMDWTAGEIDGVLNIATNAVLNIEGSVSLYAMTTNSGTLTIETNGELAINALMTVQGKLTNYGTVNWRSGTNYFYSGGIWNQTNGLWNIQCDSFMFSSFANARFHNAGMLLKTVGGSPYGTQLSCPLDNSGTIEAKAGMIEAFNGGIISGVIQADTNAAIYLWTGIPIDSIPIDLEGFVSMQGPGTVEIRGTFLGSFSGTVNSYQGIGLSLTIQSNGIFNLPPGPENGLENQTIMLGPMTNYGTVTMSQSSVLLIDDVFWNQPGAVCSLQDDSGVGYGIFTNAGLIVKTTGAGEAGIGSAFYNSGTVVAKSGTINIAGDATVTGEFQADTNAAILFGMNNASVELEGMVNMEGPGTVTIEGDQFGGTFSGVLNEYGAWVPSGLTIESNGVLNLSGYSYALELIGPLTNYGTVNWRSGEIDVDQTSGPIWNQPGSVWNILCDRNLVGGGDQFYNAGLVRKTAGAGVTAIGDSFYNTGTIEADAGTIVFQDGYFNTPTATLLFNLGGAAAGSGFGQLAFTNPPAFLGTLSVAIQGGFQPTPGETFSLLNYPAATNDFSCFNLDLGDGVLLEPQFGPTALTLKAAAYTITTNAPDLLISLAGSNVTLQWPAAFPNWTLQSTTNLESPNWQTVPSLCGNLATMPLLPQQEFLRLISP